MSVNTQIQTVIYKDYNLFYKNKKVDQCKPSKNLAFKVACFLRTVRPILPVVLICPASLSHFVHEIIWLFLQQCHAGTFSELSSVHNTIIQTLSYTWEYFWHEDVPSPCSLRLCSFTRWLRGPRPMGLPEMKARQQSAHCFVSAVICSLVMWGDVDTSGAAALETSWDSPVKTL